MFTVLAQTPAGDGDDKKGKKGGGGGTFIVDVLVNTAPPPGGAGSASTSGALPRGTPVKLLPPGDKSGVPMVVTFSINQARHTWGNQHHLAACRQRAISLANPKPKQPPYEVT